MENTREGNVSSSNAVVKLESEPSQHAGYIPTFDGWRAIAIIGVILSHAQICFFGGHGVSIFFGLSGLLICTRLIREERRHGFISLKGFYSRRMFRIFPAYYTYLLTVAGIQVVGLVQISRSEWLSCIFFFRNYLPDIPHTVGWWVLAHFWTLAPEEHFYLILPALLIITGSFRVPTVTALAIGTCIWRALDFRFRFTNALLPNVYWYNRTDHMIDALFWGAFVALIWSHQTWRSRLHKILTVNGTIFTGLVILASWIIQFKAHEVLEAILIPLLLAGTALNANSLIFQPLEWEPLRWVGRLSYSLYLWQQLFLFGLPGPKPFGYLSMLPLNLIAVFACAIASYYLIERPMVQLGHRFTRRGIPAR